MNIKYHINAEDEHFVHVGDDVFREGKVFRTCIDINTGKALSRELIRSNHAKVMYDTQNLKIEESQNKL